MPKDRPLQFGSATSQRDRAPSVTAQARLSDALRDRADAYRQDASLDLTMIEALLRLDEPEAAARTIDGHREALLAMARDLQGVVADAAVEREAEAVCHAVQSSTRTPAAVGGVRRRVLTMAGAAAVVVALILPQARLYPRTTLTSVQGDSSQNDISGALQRLEAAKTWARALRAGNAELVAAPAEAGAASFAADAAAPASSGLAADLRGGSAADSSVDADVIDLEAYRARRGGAGQTPTSQPPAAEPEEPTLIDLPDTQGQVPSSGVPLSLDTEVGPAAVTPPAGDIPPLP